MDNLKAISEIVKAVLIADEQARNSDSFLYLRVLEVIAKRDEWNITLLGMSVSYFLLNMKELGAPSFETVRRTRQKIQAESPELAANRKVQAGRMEKEKEYRAFAHEII